MVSVSDMQTVNYWMNLGTLLDKAKENIPKQCRIGDTFLHYWQLLEVIYSK